LPGVALQRYEPQWDGIRAVAIGLVVAYHLGYLPGGWLGVDTFFVLSGYLITSILLAGDHPPGNVLAFWGRRARRLLPAVLLLLFVLSVYALAGGPGLVPAQLRSPALATLFYIANWQQVVAGHSYFAQFTSVSPLQQTWSLAVEEQYYLIWPLLIAAILFVVRRRTWSRRALLGATLTLAAVSAIWMGVAAHHFGSNRAYLGTDTRAWELLIGGAAAMIWPPGRAARLAPASGPAPGNSGRQGRLWSWLTALGVGGVALGTMHAGGPPGWIWDGGLVAIAACAIVVVVGSMEARDGIVARVLALPPLRWLGVISYSLYLWHWPAIVLMTTDTTGLSGWPLLVWRLAAMMTASCASFYLIERPLRRADWAALGRRLRIRAPGLASLGVLVTAAFFLLGTVTGPVASTAAVSTFGASATPTAKVHLDIPPATRADPTRAWIFGDSVMQDSSLGVIAALDATGAVTLAVNSTFPGWGLTTLHTWPSWVSQNLAHYHPQIAIGSWSWDDPEALSDPIAYRALLESFVRAMLTPTDGANGVDVVVLLQFPQAGPDTSISDPVVRQQTWVKQTRAQNAWNAIARQVVADFPGHALYLTTEQLFAPHGRFLTWMRTPQDKWVRARKLDNTHMCPYGAAQFGALITADLTPYLHLPAMKPGWEYGSWTLDPRYNDPPGACPGDQPPAGYRGVEVPRT
jgi:peptidoglycan/LPS O-acetylase OafA/YrhL